MPRVGAGWRRTSRRAADAVARFGGEASDAVPPTEDLTDAIQALVDATTGTLTPFTQFQDAMSGLDDAHKAVTDAQRAQADAVRNLGSVQAQVADEITSAQRDVIDSSAAVEDAQRGVAEAMSIVADTAGAARQGISDLAAEQQAQIDPLFAMVEAVQRLQDLKNQGLASVKGTQTGEHSGRLDPTNAKPPSALELAQAAAGVQNAATRLAGAIQTGDVSLEESKKTLELWVAQGLITQDSAAAVAAQFEAAAAQSDALQGANVKNAAATAVAAEEMKTAAERAKAISDAQDKLTSATQRSADAQDRLAKAYEDGSRRIASAQDDVASAADDVTAAEGRVASAAVDVMTAAINLSGVLVGNAQAANQAKQAWQNLADQHLITQREADEMKRKIDDARIAARRSGGGLHGEALPGRQRLLAPDEREPRRVLHPVAARKPVLRRVRPAARPSLRGSGAQLHGRR